MASSANEVAGVCFGYEYLTKTASDTVTGASPGRAESNGSASGRLELALRKDSSPATIAIVRTCSVLSGRGRCSEGQNLESRCQGDNRWYAGSGCRSQRQIFQSTSSGLRCYSWHSVIRNIISKSATEQGGTGNAYSRHSSCLRTCCASCKRT